jgi:hypothetical protein
MLSGFHLPFFTQKRHLLGPKKPSPIPQKATLKSAFRVPNFEGLASIRDALVALIFASTSAALVC